MEREDDWNLIDVYTRWQAFSEGALIGVSETAKIAGFLIPVALTSAVWAKYVAVPDGVEGQDEAGRLWDILWICTLPLLTVVRRLGA